MESKKPLGAIEASIQLTLDVNVGKSFKNFEEIPKRLIEKIEKKLQNNGFKNPEIFFRHIAKIFRGETYNGKPIEIHSLVKKIIKNILKGEHFILSSEGEYYYGMFKELDSQLKYLED